MTIVPRLFSWLNRDLIAELDLPKVSTRAEVLAKVKELKRNQKPKMFEVNNGKTNGMCLSYHSYFDVFWNSGRKQLGIADLSYYGIVKGRKQ